MDKEIKDLALEIFYILTDSDIKTVSDQKRISIQIAKLFLPQYLTRYALKSIIEQLRSCNYECEAGPLENNTAFMALCELCSIRCCEE